MILKMLVFIKMSYEKMFRGILAFCFNKSITQNFNPFKCCLWNNSMLLQTRLKYTQVSYIVCSKENDHLRIRRQKPCIISQGGTSAERTQSTHSLSFNAFSKYYLWKFSTNYLNLNCCTLNTIYFSKNKSKSI